MAKISAADAVKAFKGKGIEVQVGTPKRVKGVASGSTVLESDDGDDRVGEVISPARAALLDTVGEDGEADAPVGVPAAVADAVKGRAKKD